MMSSNYELLLFELSWSVILSWMLTLVVGVLHLVDRCQFSLF